MWTLRTADPSDLSTIYNLQNTKYRQEVFDSALPPLDQFMEEKRAAISSGLEKFFILRQQNAPQGFLKFVKEHDFWQVTIWGAWLKTLVYAGSATAFDYLSSPRLVFGVRETNRRMNKLCNEYAFRLIGRNSFFVTLTEPPYVSVARVLLYDITMDEYRQQEKKMRERSFPLEFQWNGRRIESED
jgi:hypothetical protein